MIVKFIKQFFVLITYGLTVKSSFKYKIWYFLALFKKIFFIIKWKPNYCYSYFPFKWDYIIENIYWKFLISEPWDMSPILSTYFESDIVDDFKNTDKGVFLDIWSNVWKYSVILWKLWFKCYLVEPNKFLHKYIDKNILLNDISNNLKLIPYWIDIKDNKLKLKIPGWDNFWSWSLINDYDEFEEVDVNLITFKTLIENNNINISDIRLIKVDVEWYEKNVIDSMLEYLPSFNNLKIIIEMFDDKWNVEYIIDKLVVNWFKLEKKLYWDNYIFYKK